MLILIAFEEGLHSFYDISKNIKLVFFFCKKKLLLVYKINFYLHTNTQAHTFLHHGSHHLRRQLLLTHFISKKNVCRVTDELRKSLVRNHNWHNLNWGGGAGSFKNEIFGFQLYWCAFIYLVLLLSLVNVLTDFTAILRRLHIGRSSGY